MDTAENSQDACRLCDQNTIQMYSIFDKNEDGQQILQLIKELLPLIVYRSDPLSKFICETCLDNLKTLCSFKRISQEVAEKHKEKLRSNGDTDKKNIQLFLDCQDDMADNSDDFARHIKNASTSTTDLAVLCTNCKQNVEDASTVNGELELCSDFRKALSEINKNKTSETDSQKVLRSRRRKTQPFYHELDDSLCSSLTEFTNTESSQCFDQSDVESMESDHERPSKRRRLIDTEEDDESTKGSNLMMTKKYLEKRKTQSVIDAFKEDFEFRYHPMSLLQLTINEINHEHIPDFQSEHFIKTIVQPQCKYCKQEFKNMKLLAVHEIKHMDVEMGEKIDNPLPWDDCREDADVRNKWLAYFEENGYDLDDIVIDNDQSLLIPISMDENYDADGYQPKEGQHVTLVGTKPFVMGLPLGDYTKEERKAFYQTLRVGTLNKKFCQLCRYSFKDNWAIESHYFSSACFYTCRYCGMRFNKQRHRFDEHIQEHQAKGDIISNKIFAASKLNNVVPKIIQPDKLTKETPSPEPPPPQTHLQQQAQQQPPLPQQNVRIRNFVRKTLQPNLQPKDEPMEQDRPESREIVTSQSKTGNQAYFCRKCYKVFFKLDEFNIHSKNCDYNQFPPVRTPPVKQQLQHNYNHSKTSTNNSGVNGDTHSSPAGRPMRNCVKEVGTYKDDVYIPEALLKESVPSSQSYICFICNTPFPTIYSRNSHMRIHKTESRVSSPSTSQKGKPVMNSYMNNSMEYESYGEPRIKQEPLEPMVEIHESEQNFSGSLGDGAVSITPIVKNPNQKPNINPNIIKLVQNNPNLTIKKSVEKYQQPPSSSNHHPQIGGNMPPVDADKSYKCSSCWEAFANKSHLYFHKKNQCEGSRFPCPFCKKRFGTEAAYSSHIFYSHPE